MKEVLDVLGIVEGSGRCCAFGGLLLVARFTGVYACLASASRSAYVGPASYIPLKIHNRLKSCSEI
jgi:hypothetical protein